MKIYKDFDQGSIEWVKKRLGMPTTSEFHKIVTPTGKLSGQAYQYAIRMARETLRREPSQDLDGLEHIERGKEMEPVAVKHFEFVNGITTEVVGFVTNENSGATFIMGCSPDRLLGVNAVLEVKAPTDHVHMEYMLDGAPEKYRPQRQGQLLVCERSESHFFSYNQFFPPVHKIELRDEAFISLLRRSVSEFCSMRDEIIQKIIAQGYVYTPTEVTSILDKELGDTSRELILEP